MLTCFSISNILKPNGELNLRCDEGRNLEIVTRSRNVTKYTKSVRETGSFFFFLSA